MDTIKHPEGKTPSVVATLIADIIKDKLVYDLGCGEGEFMEAMRPYAKEVRGIEQVDEWAQTAAGKGFKVLSGNAFSIPFPVADVYYCWNLDTLGLYLKAKFEKTKGIFIFGHSVRSPMMNLLKQIKVETRQLPNSDFQVHITKL